MIFLDNNLSVLQPQWHCEDIRHVKKYNLEIINLYISIDPYAPHLSYYTQISCPFHLPFESLDSFTKL